MIKATQSSPIIRSAPALRPERAAAANPEPRWAARALALVSRLRDAGASDADAARAELWSRLGVAMLAFVRRRAGSDGALSSDEVQDIAWVRTHELMQRFARHEWEPDAMRPDAFAGYLATVARNAVVDALRRRVRETALPDWNPATDADDGRPIPAVSAAPSAETDVLRREFAGALCRCVAALQPRARRAWLLRALYDLSSREIAEHPGVGVTAAHVDVILLRARRALKRCLAARGFEGDEPPAGTFVELWRVFGRDLHDDGDRIGGSE